jgi:hypothetical protein
MVKTTQQAQVVAIATTSSSLDVRATASAWESSRTRRQRIPYADLEQLESGYGRTEQHTRGMESGEGEVVQSEGGLGGKVKQVDLSLVALQTCIQSYT